MTNSQRLQTVRSHLRAWLNEHCDTYATAAADGQPLQITESIVIRDEHYCGRCFHTPTHRAVWFIEENELKITNDTGVVAVFRGDEIGDLSDQPSVIRMDSQRPAEADHNGESDDQSGEQDVRRAA